MHGYGYIPPGEPEEWAKATRELYLEACERSKIDAGTGTEWQLFLWAHCVAAQMEDCHAFGGEDALILHSFPVFDSNRERVAQLLATATELLRERAATEAQYEELPPVDFSCGKSRGSFDILGLFARYLHHH